MPEWRKFVLHGFDDGANFHPAANREALEIDEEEVLLWVVRKATLEWHAQQVVAQSHRLGVKDTRIHHLQLLRNDRIKIHVRENVAFEVDAGCDLPQLESMGGQGEHAAFGDVEHRLRTRTGKPAAERDLFNPPNELFFSTLIEDRKFPVFYREA